jgi:hypothetical protein
VASGDKNHKRLLDNAVDALEALSVTNNFDGAVDEVVKVSHGQARLQHCALIVVLL